MSVADYCRLPIGEHRLTHDCKPNSRSEPMKVTVTSEGATWKCFRCGDSGSHYRSGTSDRPIRAKTKYETLSEFGRELWSKCWQLEGIGLDYLRARHCAIPPRDGDLRYHPNLKHPCGHVGAALVACITDAVTGEPLSIHRTWIRNDGQKANIEKPRLLLQGHRKTRGVIRLWPSECVTTGLAIGEGVETCLAGAHSFTPIWSCIDAGNLAAFPVLPGIEALTIFSDNDLNHVGQDSTRKCAERWSSHAEVTIVEPRRPGADLADVVGAGE